MFIRVAPIFLLALSHVMAFVPSTRHVSQKVSPLQMGWFDNLFGGGQAEASHILLKGPNSYNECVQLKENIYKKALGGGDPKAGVSPDKLMSAFASSARAKSTCSSSKDGGSLGSFGKGQMVPEFDAVVFNKDIGVIHGPVETQFGNHLIIITDRDD